jgi:endonuclease G
MNEQSFFFSDTRSTGCGGRPDVLVAVFDRGHMTPNFALSSQYGSLAQLETFFMTNMCPQKADLNQGAWQKLEAFVVDVAQSLEHVFVISAADLW